ncbi:MAG: DUF72 domain-containing protein [Sinimarinibacterium sp.]|jgi:uncharacterized protein YecE (DUF72 family)
MKQRLRSGASGYSFKAWKGSFYPAKIRPDAMLAYYAERLPTVEINSSFYAVPKVQVLQKWAAAVPADFCFAIKAPGQITHKAQLKPDAASETLTLLCDNLAALGEKCGPLLFQLPPYLKKDAARLRDFLQLLHAGRRAAFEFRHDSWFDDEIYALLEAAGAALCLSEREDHAPPPLIETADWGYVRLRLEQYTDVDLLRWSERLAATRWRDVYAYFMHEPTAPVYAQALTRDGSAQARLNG